VISGFNTDIEVGGIVYHVQTEDKGRKAKLILSLVYDKGTILASKRALYDEVLKGGEFDEKQLAECLNRQHKLICAAVKAGRINELKEMTGKARTKKAAAQTVAVAKPAVPVAKVEIREAAPVGIPTARVDTLPVVPPPAPVPRPSEPIARPAEPPELVIDGAQIIEDDLILDGGAVEVVSELSGQERKGHNKLSIELLGEAKFRGGDRMTVNIMVCRGSERKVVASAEIMVKVLGSSFRPVIFHARSDANGLAKVHLHLPRFDAGRAALLVRAIAGGEEIELRRIVNPG
jgi:hypothetical protein